MHATLKTTLLAGTFLMAAALGAVAAHADEAADLLDAKQHAAALDKATGGNNLVSNALKDPEAKEVIESLINLISGIGVE